MIGKVKVDKMQVFPGEKEITVIATVPRSGEARRQLLQAAATAEQGKPLQFEIRRYRKGRSLSSNAYAWVLLNRLGEALRRPPEELYRELIRHMPGVSVIKPFRADTVAEWDRIWSHGRTGWQTEILGESRLPGYVDVISYYGSSAFNTEQMRIFLDLLIEECRAQGIETMPPEELERLKLEG